MAIATINPATGETLKRFEPLSGAQIEQKIQQAADTFRKFRKMSFAERAEMMRKAADILESEKETFGRLMTTEMGKTLRRRWTKPSSAPGPAATTPRTPSGFWPMKWSRRLPSAATSAISRWARCWP